MGVVCYHGIEVGEASDLSGVLVEFLVEGIGDIVGGVSGDEQHTLSHPGQQDGQTAAVTHTQIALIIMSVLCQN